MSGAAVSHEHSMRRALAEAEQALAEDEVPIGAVIVLLMWLHLSSMAFVVGAEVNSSLDMPTGNSS